MPKESNEQTQKALENLGHEDRSFPPDADFTAQANGRAELYEAAEADYEGFWSEQARTRLTWSKDFTQGLDWSQAPFATWFADGELNAAYNCVDRHVEAGNGDRVAIHFVGEPEGDTRDITYAELHEQVQRAANALPDLGIGKGDTVAIYLPMIPEAAVAMLACARHRRPALGGLRRVLRRGAELPHPGREVQARHHRRRRLPARSPGRPQAGGRRGPRPRGHPGGARARRQAHRPGRRVERPRHLVARGAREGRRHPRGAGDGGRAPAVHPLHVRHHREAEGHLPHHGRLPDPGGLHELRRARPAPRDRRLLVHRRHRLGDRPLLHRLRADGQRRDPGDVRGHARHPAPGPVVGDRREVQGVDHLHRADRDPHLHEVG